MRRAAAAVAAGGLATLAAFGCGVAEPSAPAPTADAITGAAWFDDGDRRAGAADEPLDMATVRLGAADAIFDQSTTTTDEAGGFAVARPSAGATPSDLFVEIAFTVDGPADGSITVQVRHPVADDGPTMVPIRRPAACEVAVGEAVADPDACGSVLLPDLVPLVENFDQPETQPVGPASVIFDTTTIPGATLLRLASATANLGNGPLHMIPGGDATGERLPTWQRLWTDESLFLDRPTGAFVFHPGHDHFHLDDFELYRLLTPDGEQVATSAKISFCLIDSLAASGDAQRLGFGVYLDAACEEAGMQQALQAGWADYYGNGLPDQWIDVTGVEAGDYLIEIVVDPNDLLLESDETNNSARFAVTIPNGITTAVEAD